MLKEGDILSLEDGREVPVQSIETITYNHYVNVYNFEVDDFHTYYVSDVSVLVHNKTSCKKLAKTNTVWDNIKTTQKNNNGSNIPKSFELNLGNKKYWVHPNATKHMMEYLNKDTVKYSHGKK